MARCFSLPLIMYRPRFEPSVSLTIMSERNRIKIQCNFLAWKWSLLQVLYSSLTFHHHISFGVDLFITIWVRYKTVCQLTAQFAHLYPDPWLSSIPASKLSTPRRQVALLTPERLPNLPSNWRRQPAGQPLLAHSLTSTPSTADVDEPQRPHSIDSWLTSIPDTSTNTMFQFPEKYAMPSTPRDRPPSRASPSRMGSWALTPRKLALIAASCFGILILKFFLSLSEQAGVCLGL